MPTTRCCVSLTIHLLVCLAGVAGIVTLSGGSGSAQTASTPVPASDRPDFSGTWSLDRGLSTDPSQVNLVPGAGRNQPNRRAGAGFGSFGRQRRTGGTASGNAAEPLTADEQAGLKALSDQLKTSSATIVITHQDPSFIVSDAQSNALFFQTNGTSDQNHLETATLPSATHWDGSRLVTEYVLGSHVTVVYTYTLLAKTNQLVVRIDRQAGGNRRDVGPEIKLVYTRPASAPR